jgi:putative tryptophan/tyrosine transport system substrate-binding protein
VITRRTVLLAVGIGLLVTHGRGRGQSAGTLRRVGVLFFPSQAATAHARAAFTQELNDLGWLGGKNVAYRFVYADGDVGRMDGLTRELIGQKVDVIVTPSPPATRVAQRATKTIPIVMVSVPNAAGEGFVTSLARPGGNITGVTNQQEEALGKVIEILHEVTPGARRIAILLNESAPSHDVYWTRAQSACAALGLVAIQVVASEPAQLGGAVERIVRQQAQAVVVARDGMYFDERAKLQGLMQATQLPVAYGFREHVDVGGLLSYSADLAENFRLAARYVDKILRGAKPADLPVEQPTKFELVINLKTATTLGLKIPQSLLLRADEVIQ